MCISSGRVCADEAGTSQELAAIPIATKARFKIEKLGTVLAIALNTLCPSPTSERRAVSPIAPFSILEP